MCRSRVGDRARVHAVKDSAVISFMSFESGD